VPQLDALLNGGLPQGHSVLVVGPTGSGKTILATSFLAEGAIQGENGVVASFEKGASRLRNAKLAELVQSGQVAIFESRAMDLSVEEILDDLLRVIDRMQAKRVVIDSLSEITLYLAPECREHFRETVFRILTGLAKAGVSVVVTLGLEDRFTEMRFSKSEISFLTDAVITMRYVEIESQLKKLIAVVKVRGSPHSHDLRQYEITDKGIEIGERLPYYDGLLSGHPNAHQLR
jgi:circadian clock protein KaiC